MSLIILFQYKPVLNEQEAHHSFSSCDARRVAAPGLTNSIALQGSGCIRSLIQLTVGNHTPSKSPRQSLPGLLLVVN